MEKKGEVIVFGEAVVNKALVNWLKANREQDRSLIQESSDRLGVYKDIYPMAKYFGGLAKMQLVGYEDEEDCKKEKLEQDIIDIFQALEILLNELKFDPGQLFRACKSMLEGLADRVDFIELNYEMPLKPTVEEIKQVVVEINKRGLEKHLLAEVFAYMEAFLDK